MELYLLYLYYSYVVKTKSVHVAKVLLCDALKTLDVSAD